MPISVTIPMEALAIMDGEESVAPSAGDAISVTLEGTVEDIVDGAVTVYATTANGVDLEGDTGPEPEMDREGMLSMLEGAQL